MKREILFRAKTVDTGEWVKGYVVRRYGTWFVYESKNADTCRQNTHVVDSDTICQYSGETDVNENKIYENDIVMFFDNPYYLAKIVFGEFDVIDADTDRCVDTVKGWYFDIIPYKLKGIKRYQLPILKDYINACNIKVIGNVFDSKRLIGDTEDGESR